MRFSAGFLVVLVLGVNGGCSSIAGTWTEDASGKTRSPIANVSFCEDHTFTASADYGGGRSHVMSGHYSTTRDAKLILEADGNKRTYVFEVTDDTLIMGKGEKSAKLKRLKPNGKR